MVADWDALQNSFLEQVTKLAELAVADEALEKRIAAARTNRARDRAAVRGALDAQRIALLKENGFQVSPKLHPLTV
eukprot:gene339-30615_t